MMSLILLNMPESILFFMQSTKIIRIIILFIQHLLSALYTNKHALMRYLINKYIYIYIYIYIYTQ